MVKSFHILNVISSFTSGELDISLACGNYQLDHQILRLLSPFILISIFFKYGFFSWCIAYRLSIPYLKCLALEMFWTFKVILEYLHKHPDIFLTFK